MRILRQLAQYYDRDAKAFGDSIKAVNWSSRESQAMRFAQFMPFLPVEPFSLNLSVSTSFHRNESESFGSVQDQILVVATLPRLVFDLNASVVRLLRRLQTQWNQRKQEMQSSLLLPTRVFGGLAGREQRVRAVDDPPDQRRRHQPGFC